MNETYTREQEQRRNRLLLRDLLRREIGDLYGDNVLMQILAHCIERRDGERPTVRTNV